MHFNSLNINTLRPFKCANLIRVGNSHDGGYVVPKIAIDKSKILLSFGVSTNWTFEKCFYRIKKCVQLYAYDHTVGKKEFIQFAILNIINLSWSCFCLNLGDTKMALKNILISFDYFIFFKKYHIKKQVWYRNDRNSITINEIIDKLNIKENFSIFVKMDIEGSEYRVLPDLIENYNLINCITLEFHDLDICSSLFNHYIEALKQYFYIVHIHGNNYSDLSLQEKFPLVVELTLLNKNLLEDPVFSTASYPIKGLDSPNNPDALDYNINF